MDFAAAFLAGAFFAGVFFAAADTAGLVTSFPERNDDQYESARRRSGVLLRFLNASLGDRVYDPAEVASPTECMSASGAGFMKSMA